DVKTVLIAQEELTGAREAEAHYRAILEDFERDPVGIKGRFPGFDEAAERWKKQADGEPLPPDPAAEGLDPISRALRERMGSIEPDMQAKIAEAMKKATAGLDPSVDLEAEIKKADANAADMPPIPRVMKPGYRPDVGIRRKVRELMAQVAKVRKS